jgi:hypothetical protein
MNKTPETTEADSLPTEVLNAQIDMVWCVRESEDPETTLANFLETWEAVGGTVKDFGVLVFYGEDEMVRHFRFHVRPIPYSIGLREIVLTSDDHEVASRTVIGALVAMVESAPTRTQKMLAESAMEVAVYAKIRHQSRQAVPDPAYLGCGENGPWPFGPWPFGPWSCGDGVLQIVARSVRPCGGDMWHVRSEDHELKGRGLSHVLKSLALVDPKVRAEIPELIEHLERVADDNRRR